MFPLLRVHVHDIRVRHDVERAFRAVAAEASDQVGPLRIEGKKFRLDAFGLLHALEGVDRREFVARRITRVEAKKRLKMSHRLFVDCPFIRGRCGLGGAEIHNEKQRDKTGEATVDQSLNLGQAVKSGVHLVSTDR